MIYCFPLSVQIDAWLFSAFLLLWHHLVSSDVPPSNKQPVNFAHISIKRKEKREKKELETALITHGNPLYINGIVQSMCHMNKKQFLCSQKESIGREDIDILLLVVYLWFSFRLSAAANHVLLCVSCNEKIL